MRLHLRSSLTGRPPWRRYGVLVIAVTVLALAACGDDNGAGNGTPPEGPLPPVTSGPVSAVGPGIGIAEAIALNSTEPLLVNGAIVATAEEIRFCSALLESYPPQCGGDSLRVEGLDLTTLEGLTSAGGVTWSDQPVQLLGLVQDGMITVNPTALG